MSFDDRILTAKFYPVCTKADPLYRQRGEVDLCELRDAEQPLNWGGMAILAQECLVW